MEGLRILEMLGEALAKLREVKLTAEAEIERLKNQIAEGPADGIAQEVVDQMLADKDAAFLAEKEALLSGFEAEKAKLAQDHASELQAIKDEAQKLIDELKGEEVVETPVEEIPSEETPTEELPAEEVEETPVDEAPADEGEVVEETPSEGTEDGEAVEGGDEEVIDETPADEGSEDEATEGGDTEVVEPQPEEVVDGEEKVDETEGQG